MKKKLSIITSAVLLTASAAYAEIKGTVSGDITAHYQSVEEGSTDSGFSNASLGLNFTTEAYNGFSANVGFRGNHKLAEEKDGNYAGDFENKAVATLANITYSKGDLTVVAGRQEIDLEWLGDYNDALVVAYGTKNLELVAGYVNRQAAVGHDESKKFAEITKDGAYVVDAKIKTIDSLTLNPYYYSAVDVANFYGIKADLEADMFALSAQYAASSEDVANTKDGSIMHLGATANISTVELSAGYIAAGKDNGVASISAYGDNIDPTEELGDSVYGKDAKTIYAGVATEVSGLELSALYASVDIDNKTDKELTFGAAYGISDDLTAEVLYVDASKETGDDLTKVAATVTYEF